MQQRLLIKYGGAAMTSETLKAQVIEDLVALAAEGRQVVLVHGGGPELSAFMERQGKEPRFVDGLRYTDEETLEAALMVLAGKVNKGLVALIEDSGGRAAGLCGVDGGMVRAVRALSAGGGDLGFVGEIADVDTALLQGLLDGGIIPVVASLGLGWDGQIYNINADTLAAALAPPLGAELVVLSDIPGVLRDVDDPASLIPELRTGAIPRLIEEGIIRGGMIPKITGCAAAVERGAASATIADGRIPHALQKAIAEAGVGTKIIP